MWLKNSRTMRVVLVVLSTLMVGCSMGINYGAWVDLPEQGWLEKQNAVFHFSSLPGVPTSEISVFFRANEQLNIKNPRLIVKTIDPDGLFWQDTVQMPAVNSRQAIKTSSIVLRNNVRWRKIGKYAISIRPTDSLSGALTIGVEISNVVRDESVTSL
ncbi:MAG: hypothetical protein RSC35_01705 [Mucinivorans sp.]